MAVTVQDFVDLGSLEIVAEHEDLVNFLNKRLDEERRGYREMKSKIIENISVRAKGM